jgi:hypothetical protein
MRKVHKKAIHLLWSGVTGRPGPNDEVVTVNENCMDGYTESVKVWKYHGNIIAKVDSSGKLHVNWHGYYTHSTNERIYALCGYLGLSRPKKARGFVEVR